MLRTRWPFAHPAMRNLESLNSTGAATSISTAEGVMLHSARGAP
jgi:hypothetical protein